MKKILFILSLAFVMNSCGEENNVTPNVDQSIAGVITRSDVSHKTFEAALTSTGLLTTLQGEGSYTVFAPTDDAFTILLGDLGYATLEEVPVDVLTKVLKYHICTGSYTAATLTNNQTLTTLEGQTLTVQITEEEGTSIVDSTTGFSPVTYADWTCSNGTVHVIDRVLIPAL